MKAHTSEFSRVRTQALADGTIDGAEATKLTEIATKRIRDCKNPEPTYEMFRSIFEDLTGKATDDGASMTMSYWHQFQGNSAMQARAADTLNRYFKAHRGEMPAPASAVAMDNRRYQAIANENWEHGVFRGGIVVTDNSSDSDYLRVPVDVTKLGMTGRESQDELDTFMGVAQEQMNNFVKNTPELKYSGASVDVVLVKPKR